MQQIPADANEVVGQLSMQVGQLSKEIAILKSQLSAAMKLIPIDVLEAMNKEENDGRD
nr:MAG TPA: major outer membrane lipoprotein [Caudoviricetes sp.]